MINDGIPLVNGIAYSWSDIKTRIAGQLVIGITGLDYGQTRQVDNIYGMGSNPVARGYGRNEATAKLTLLKDEVVALERAAEGHDITNIPPFDITVSYVPLNQSKIKTDIIKNCQFKGNSASWKEGDSSNAVELELLPSHIIYG
ncbi:MAG: hypothetical protein LBU51_00750 [Bacteroidales bacterium]|jgi:hypothetical protein|nr:hypothetical protein [Bacteroidales bacterium]